MVAMMGHGETVLVVDDVSAQRAIATALLQRLRYQVVTVSSGEEALEYLREHDVDLIILDMIMEPGMDGLETYRRIVKIKPDQKAIIASGYSETERVRQALSLGDAAFISKPYVLENISAAIRNMLYSSPEGKGISAE
jgi:CheY-like chemotaxis protein